MKNLIYGIILAVILYLFWKKEVKKPATAPTDTGQKSAVPIQQPAATPVVTPIPVDPATYLTPDPALLEAAQLQAQAISTVGIQGANINSAADQEAALKALADINAKIEVAKQEYATAQANFNQAAEVTQQDSVNNLQQSIKYWSTPVLDYVQATDAETVDFINAKMENYRSLTRQEYSALIQATSVVFQNILATLKTKVMPRQLTTAEIQAGGLFAFNDQMNVYYAEFNKWNDWRLNIQDKYRTAEMQNIWKAQEGAPLIAQANNVLDQYAALDKLQAANTNLNTVIASATTPNSAFV